MMAQDVLKGRQSLDEGEFAHSLNEGGSAQFYAAIIYLLGHRDGIHENMDELVQSFEVRGSERKVCAPGLAKLRARGTGVRHAASENICALSFDTFPEFIHYFCHL